MSLKVADRVFETSSTQSTGPYTLAGPVNQFRSFVAGVGNGAEVPYVVEDGANWEIGIGTITAGPPDILARTTILASTNADAAVNWGPGTRNVRLAPISSLFPSRDKNLNFLEGFGTIAGTANALTMDLLVQPKALSDGMIVHGFIVITNTGAVKLKIGTLPQKDVTNAGVALASGALPAGAYFRAVYNAANDQFYLIEPINVSQFATASQGTKADSALSALAGSILGSGLLLSNNATDVTNDIDISAGSCVSDDGTTLINVPALTKQLDVAFAAGTTGTPSGGRSSAAAIANTTYHLFAVSKDGGLTPDVIMDVSLTSPTMPSTYTKKCYIGSIIRVSNAIVTFFQVGREFTYKMPKQEANTTGTGGYQTITLAYIPVGIKCMATINAYTTNNASVLYLSSPETDSNTPSTESWQLGGNAVGEQVQIKVLTNASSQIKSYVGATTYNLGLSGYTNTLLRRY